MLVSPPILPGAVTVVLPPERINVPEMAAELVTVPPSWDRYATVPPVRVAVPS